MLPQKQYRRLTPRELGVLLCIADGLTTEETAEDLNIALNTVKHHIKAVMLSLGAKNRAHAVAIAYHHGILLLPNN